MDHNPRVNPINLPKSNPEYFCRWTNDSVINCVQVLQGVIGWTLTGVNITGPLSPTKWTKIKTPRIFSWSLMLMFSTSNIMSTTYKEKIFYLLFFVYLYKEKMELIHESHFITFFNHWVLFVVKYFKRCMFWILIN